VFNINKYTCFGCDEQVILKPNVPTKRGKTSRSIRRKENQEELTMMSHQAPLQVMKKKQMYV